MLQYLSISTAQAGLQGVDLGHLLIKRVVERLRSEWPAEILQDVRFSTLSPIPGFASWLDTRLAQHDTKFCDEENLFSDKEIELLCEMLSCENRTDLFRNLRDRAVISARLQSDERFRDAIREPFVRLAAKYIVMERNECGTCISKFSYS